MEQDLEDLVVRRLIAADPVLSLEETLRVIVVHARGTSGGVFAARGHGAELRAAVRASKEMLARVQRAWSSEHDRLDAGRPICEGSWCVCPTETASGAVLVYVESSGLIDTKVVSEAVRRMRPLLSSAMRAHEAGAHSVDVVDEVVDSFLEKTSPDAVARRQLQSLLNHHEWNVSRVARALGCNRVTVYKRMARYGIERQRVDKTVKGHWRAGKVPRGA